MSIRKPESRSGKNARRARRRPEEARALILEVAERRLAEHGLAGLNITDVARDAGISHGTLLHHFGSSESMRTALVVRMAERLLDEVLGIEHGSGADVDGMAGFFERLFAELSSGGHGRLIAWLALSRSDGDSRRELVSATVERFDQLVQHIAGRLEQAGHGGDADRTARYLVLLVISSAIGLGVARDSLLPELTLDEADEAGYARWLARVIGTRLGAP